MRHTSAPWRDESYDRTREISRETGAAHTRPYGPSTKGHVNFGMQVADWQMREAGGDEGSSVNSNLASTLDVLLVSCRRYEGSAQVRLGRVGLLI